MELGATVVREVAKLGGGVAGAAAALPILSYDAARHCLDVRLPGRDAYRLHPATLRRADTSAASINEWTGTVVLKLSGW